MTGIDWGIILDMAGMALVVLLLLGVIEIGKQKGFVKPPRGRKWMAKFPDGVIAYIKGYYTNHNGITIWQFKNMKGLELAAELDYDVFGTPKAWAGMRGEFLVFNKTLAGASVEWDDPAYADYFKRMSKVREKIQRDMREESIQSEYATLAQISLKRKTETGLAEKHALSKNEMALLLGQRLLAKRMPILGNPKGKGTDTTNGEVSTIADESNRAEPESPQ